MANVRVVTDSACDLSKELASSVGITVVPLTIRFGVEEFFDGVNLASDEFWRRCKGSSALPETAAPSPGAFKEAFDKAADEGASGVLCLTLSSSMSATHQSALTAASTVEDRIQVTVIDTRSVTMGQGLLCLEAAEHAAKGESLEDIAARVTSCIDRTKVLGVLGSLDHLQRGGRVGGVAALVGSLLSIKPVIQVKDGKVEQESKQRTRSRALDYMTAKVSEAGPLDWLAVCNGDASDIDDVVTKVRNLPVAHDLVVMDLGAVVGTHTGPETVGICYMLSNS